MSQFLIVHSFHFYKIYFLNFVPIWYKKAILFFVILQPLPSIHQLKITKSQQNSTKQTRNDLFLTHSAVPVKRYWTFSVLDFLHVVFYRVYHRWLTTNFPALYHQWLVTRFSCALPSVTDNKFSRVCCRFYVLLGLQFFFAIFFLLFAPVT